MIGYNPAGSQPEIHFWGIGETLFLRNPDDSPRPWIASSYELSPTADSVTIEIRENIEFQGGFGPLTAEDVAWSLNQASLRTNPSSLHTNAANFAGYFEEWQVIDSNTIQFDFAYYDTAWIDDLLSQSGGAFTVFSKAAYESMGESYVTDNIVATGPFTVDSASSTRLEIVSRYSDGGSHYLPDLTPESDRVIFIKTASSAVALSALKNGTVDAASLEPSEGAAAVIDGFEQTETGAGVQLGIFFAGNLWEETSAVTGLPLTRSTYAIDYAWIGNPDDATDMEEARLVREALALSIDRDSINQQIVGGIGSPVHVTYFSTAHPNWDPKWEYGYDPSEAANILTNQVSGDYYRGAADLSASNLGGNAFQVSLYVGPELGGAASITGDIAQAIADGWTQLGLNASLRTDTYQSWRPGLVDRTNTDPWITSCDLGRESRHWHAPKGLVQTSFTRDNYSRGGFSCGFEAPEIVDFFLDMTYATTMEEATLVATAYLDFVRYWNLQPGVVDVPFSIYYNPDTIEEWPMPRSVWSDIDGVWDLKPR